jgi:hypothetical protein
LESSIAALRNLERTDRARLCADAALDALLVIDLQVETVHVKRHLGAHADTAGALQAFAFVVSETFHKGKYTKISPQECGDNHKESGINRF